MRLFSFCDDRNTSCVERYVLTTYQNACLHWTTKQLDEDARCLVVCAQLSKQMLSIRLHTA